MTVCAGDCVTVFVVKEKKYIKKRAESGVSLSSHASIPSVSVA